MRLLQIVKMPTVIGEKHESIFRAYHILEKVKYLLDQNVPNNVISELIHEMGDKDSDE